ISSTVSLSSSFLLAVACFEEVRLRTVLPKYSSGAELIFIEFPDYSTRDERRQLITHELIKRDLGHLPPCFLVVSNGEADLLA
ncbi:MAG: hypothetical protein ACI406_09115, partial [Victivallis vadensis]